MTLVIDAQDLAAETPENVPFATKPFAAAKRCHVLKMRIPERIGHGPQPDIGNKAGNEERGDGRSKADPLQHGIVGIEHELLERR